MTAKQKQREAALKRAKQKKIITLAASALVVVAIVLAVVLWPRSEANVASRVFAIGGSQVEFFEEDGSFMARDPKGFSRVGTFTESDVNGVAIITFSYGNGQTAIGQIVDDVLTIPDDWVPVCGHSHSPHLPLR